MGTSSRLGWLLTHQRGVISRDQATACGITPAELRHRIRLDGAVAVEVDSKQWHLLPEDWERTIARSRALSAAGIQVMHLSPNQLRRQPAEIAGQLASALAAGRPAARVTWTSAPR